VLIGYEQSEQLDVAPAQYFVRVIKREKRACKSCEEQGVRCAPLPPRIIEKGLASDRVVIDTVVSKYLDYLPLYRQSAILERETGLEISRATLDVWVMRVGELRRPITEAMAKELRSGNYIQADETPVGVQSDSVQGKNLLTYLWQYSRPSGRPWAQELDPHCSEEVGPRVAAIISIMETCRRLSIPIRDYLGSVLPGLANFSINRIAELTPTAWAARI
jgi:transposase